MKQRASKKVEYQEDPTLWQAFKRGDQQAYATIYHQYVRLLFQYGCRLCPDRELVKDVVQDVFFYLWEHRADLSDVQYIRYYLLTVLRRRIIAQNSPSSPLEIHDYAVTTASFEQECILDETKRDNQRYLHRGLSSLTERQREAIFLRYYQDMPVSEIAQVMGVRRRAVYQLLKNAIQTLTRTWPEAAQRVTKLSTLLFCGLQLF